VKIETENAELRAEVASLKSSLEWERKSQFEKDN
jgi:hypothetical protein